MAGHQERVGADTLCEWGAVRLSRAIHSGEVTCVEVMTAYLDRIHRINPQFNAIVSLRDDDALLADAAECDVELEAGASRGWMHGVPHAVKDLACTAGLVTTYGTPHLRDFVPEADDLVVERIRAAGAIIIGKTNTPEFGLGSHTVNPVFGATLNPWGASRSAGGSSGGAAAALALRLLPCADGSDFMGSLRNPAGWNHVIGFRPSLGRVPHLSGVGAAPADAGDVFVGQLGATEGPMGRTVEDVAALLGTLSGADKRAPLCISDGPLRVPLEASALPALTSVRIAWLGDLGGYLPMEDGVLNACETALGKWQVAGMWVTPTSTEAIDWPEVWEAWLVWRRVLTAPNVAPFVLGDLTKSEFARWEHAQAASVSAADLMKASRTRSLLLQQVLALFDAGADVLVLPSAQVWPFDVTLRYPTRIGNRDMDTYHRWMEVTLLATMCGLPCLAVPAWVGSAGLPIGLQMIGRPRADAELLQIGAALETALGGQWLATPPVAGP